MHLTNKHCDLVSLDYKKPAEHRLNSLTGQNIVIDLPSVVLKINSFDVENQFNVR